MEIVEINVERKITRKARTSGELKISCQGHLLAILLLLLSCSLQSVSHSLSTTTTSPCQSVVGHAEEWLYSTPLHKSTSPPGMEMRSCSVQFLGKCRNERTIKLLVAWIILLCIVLVPWHVVLWWVVGGAAYNGWPY